MTPTESPAPQSRRERPAKPALTRERIIEVGLTILEAEGLGKVTMRRIAAALDTGPASLYVYVRDTEELHTQILDALLGRMAPISGRGPWRKRLRDLLTRYSEVLAVHPAIARMTLTTQPVGPHYFSLVESILGLLHEAGVPDPAAAWAIQLLLSTLTANVIEHAAEGENVEGLAVIAEAIAAASGKSYPRIVHLGEEMLSGTGIERFNWGVDVLINGILSTPRGRSTSKHR